MVRRCLASLLHDFVMTPFPLNVPVLNVMPIWTVPRTGSAPQSFPENFVHQSVHMHPYLLRALVFRALHCYQLAVRSCRSLKAALSVQWNFSTKSIHDVPSIHDVAFGSSECRDLRHTSYYLHAQRIFRSLKYSSIS